MGRVPIEVWEDTFNSTYKVTNYEPPKGVTSVPELDPPIRPRPPPVALRSV